MGRNLTNLYISESFQFITQTSGSELQTGLGTTITSVNITASNAVSSSYSNTSTSASYALVSTTSSFAINATSASFATTASFALNAGVTVSTASLLTTASAVNNVITFTKGDGSTFPVTVATGSATTVNTGSLLTTASFSDAQITFTKGDGSTFSGVINNVTSSISASFATNAISASFATNSNTATSASFATSASQAVTSSVALKVRTTQRLSEPGAHFLLFSDEAQQGGQATVQFDLTTFFNPSTNTLSTSNVRSNTYNDYNDTGNASFLGNATTATSASFATSASQAVSASFATSASQAQNSVSASFATTASFVASVVSASYALSASQAQNANTASFALNIADNLSPTFVNVTASNALITGTASIAFLNVTIESSSVIYSSGSNQFGDASNDTQTLFGTVDVKTGPLVVTGSITTSGSITMVNGTDLITHHIKAPAVNGVEIQNNTAGVVALFGAGGSLGTTFYGQINGTTFVGTASLATSASQAVSSSFATTASFATNTISASFATSASQAQNAVNANTATSATTAATASFTPNALVTASVSSNVLTFTKGDGSTFNLTVNTGSAGGTIIWTDITGSGNAIGYESTEFLRYVPVGGPDFVSGSIIFGKAISGSIMENVASLGGRGHRFYDPTGGGWSIQNAGVLGGLNNTFASSGSGNFTIGGNSNTVEANNINNSGLIGASNSRVYSTQNTVVAAGTSIDVRTQSDRSFFAAGSSHTIDRLADSVILGSTGISTGQGPVVSKANFIGAASLSLNNYGTDINDNIAVINVNGSAGTRQFPESWVLYTEKLKTFAGAELTGSVRGNVSGLTISSNTASLDCSVANFFALSLVSGSVTHINPTNIKPGQTINLQLVQPAAGYGNITYPGSIKTQNGQQITPTLAPNAVDIVSLVSFDTSALYATTVKNLQ